MNDFNGKRTDRMRFPGQVAFDPEMSSEIRMRASRRRRSLGAQIVHLLTVGLSHDWETAFNEHGVPSDHGKSLQVTVEETPQIDTPFLAQPRTATHGQSHKRLQKRASA